GSEVVARLLGLRLNHPASQDSLELLPNNAATRAEAAYSAAQILDFQGYEIPSVQLLADTFALPSDYTDWQKLILTTAFARVGMPYIWGGTSDGPETEFGVSSRGGYDCSGFVWRVYKLQSYPNEGDLASVLKGRTTFQMSGEVPKSERIAFANLQPGDVIFFGDKGPKSQPSQVGHTGIYVGNGWFVHSSEYGVALAQLTGWYANEFAGARRPLAEAGLENQLEPGIKAATRQITPSGDSSNVCALSESRLSGVREFWRNAHVGVEASPDCPCGGNRCACGEPRRNVRPVRAGQLRLGRLVATRPHLGGWGTERETAQAGESGDLRLPQSSLDRGPRRHGGGRGARRGPAHARPRLPHSLCPPRPRPSPPLHV